MDLINHGFDQSWIWSNMDFFNQCSYVVLVSQNQ